MKRINPVWLQGEDATSVTVVKKDGKVILVSYGGQIELTRKEGQMLLGIAKGSWTKYQREGAHGRSFPPFPLSRHTCEGAWCGPVPK